MFDFTFDLLNGVKIGLEHISSMDEDSEIEYLVILDILVFRFSMIKYREQE